MLSRPNSFLSIGVDKRIFQGKPEGKRRSKAPRQRWLDDLEAVLRRMKVWSGDGENAQRRANGRRLRWRSGSNMCCSAVDG